MIKLGSAKYESFNFPVGEKNVTLTEVYSENVNIFFNFEKNEEIIELLLLVDAIKRESIIKEIYLYMPYVPFSRQDRVCNKGEALSLKVFCDLINQCKFIKVFIQDPHSDVAPALLDNCLVGLQHEIFYPFLCDRKNLVLISPDSGATKKITELSKILSVDVIQCSKTRDLKTGNITGIVVNEYNLHKKDCIIVDDICDGGRTFIEISKKLKEINCGKIILCVTHGFFTKGLEVFDNLIDEIYTNKGRIK